MCVALFDKTANSLIYRVDEATQKAADAQSELQVQKRRNVQLEKNLGKAKVEQSQSGNIKYTMETI